MQIAVHQMCSGIEPLQNANIMKNTIAAAARDGAAMYFAPEMSILIDRDRNRVCAIMRRDTGRDAFGRFDGEREVGGVTGIGVRHHQRQAQLLAAVACQR